MDPAKVYPQTKITVLSIVNENLQNEQTSLNNIEGRQGSESGLNNDTEINIISCKIKKEKEKTVQIHIEDIFCINYEQQQIIKQLINSYIDQNKEQQKINKQKTKTTEEIQSNFVTKLKKIIDCQDSQSNLIIELKIYIKNNNELQKIIDNQKSQSDLVIELKKIIDNQENQSNLLTKLENIIDNYYGKREQKMVEEFKNYIKNIKQLQKIIDNQESQSNLITELKNIIDKQESQFNLVKELKKIIDNQEIQVTKQKIIDNYQGNQSKMVKELKKNISNQESELKELEKTIENQEIPSNLIKELKKIIDNEETQSNLVTELKNIIDKIYQWIRLMTKEIETYSKNLKDNEIEQIFKGKSLHTEEIKAIIFKQKEFYEDCPYYLLKNIFQKTNNFNFLENINIIKQSSDLISSAELQLKQQHQEQKQMILILSYQHHLQPIFQDMVPSKVKVNLFGLIFWIGPFADQILDVIYLITGDFYSPIFFYLYFITFMLSLIGVFANVFNQQYKSNKKKSEKKPFVLFIQTFLISIFEWLKIKELIYLLGFRKFIRDHFEPDIEIAYCNNHKKFLYNDPKEIDKKQRMNQKIELYLENLPQCFILIINQTLLHYWTMFNLVQSSLSFTLMVVSAIKFYAQDYRLEINNFKDLFDLVLFKFGHFYKGLQIIYATTVLCVNLIALNQIDDLDDSSGLTIFKKKFNSQINFAITSIVIDTIHFILLIVIFSNTQGHKQNKRDLYRIEQLEINSCVKLILFIYIIFIDYFIYVILQIAYTYFEFKMYHMYYQYLKETIDQELNIMRFRFSYFMLIIFSSTYIVHPLPYIPIAIFEVPLFIFFILFGFLFLILKCFGRTSERIREIMRKIAELMIKAFN